MAPHHARTIHKVFIDSSVFFAAAYSVNGSAHDLLQAGLLGRVTLVISDFVLEETERNLAENAPGALPAFRLLLSSLSFVLAKPTKQQITRGESVVDRKDASIVAGAKAGRADMLATYDRKHLLAHSAAIERALGVRVATPDEVLRILGTQEKEPAA